jgi:carbonic anhydrase
MTDTICHIFTRRIKFAFVICGLAFSAAFAAAPQAFAQADHAAHWEYSGADGPARWGDLDPAYATCKTGVHQSPIDIKLAKKDSSLTPLQFDYKASPLKIINNGHTIRINYAPGSSVTVNGTVYPLTQFHFHKPSEEEIAGKKFDMVIHLVHETPHGAVVVALLVKSGSENAVIQKVWANIPAEVGKEVAADGVTVNAADLLPANQNYYTFAGSLTTPPCAEGVEWYVMKTPIQFSAAQIAAFAKIYPMNARPMQPTKGREIKESDFKTP